MARSGVPAPVPAGSMTGELRDRVYLRGRELYRDLPWRRTRDPYAIWVSETMLQQTQVGRVDGRWQRWLERFPSVGALAAASSADVLDEWQGLGYNRRALALWRAACQVADEHAGQMPSGVRELQALPGIGPATAAGIRAFAYDMPGTYLETNVRAVFLHELFPGQQDVPDSAISPLVAEACPKIPLGVPGADAPCTPRTWYYALLDYGYHLKQTLPNPSRRSRSHARQSRFEGSHRQKRAAVVRLLLDAHGAGTGLSPSDVAASLTQLEAAAGRAPVDEAYAREILAQLEREGFCRERGGRWLA